MDTKKMSESEIQQPEPDKNLDENDLLDQSDLSQELEKINNLGLSQIESYLKASPKKIVPNASTIANQPKVIRKNPSRISRENNPNISHEHYTNSSTTISSSSVAVPIAVASTQPQPIPVKKVSELNRLDVIIQGRKINLSKEDYERFTRNRKWASCEFFRFLTASSEGKCRFCKRKCKTITDGIYMCTFCRHFAHKSLVKHHMFVCKKINKEDNEYCRFEANVEDYTKAVFCRYCHFRLIVNNLPNLSRLQNHLVQFINNRVLFVNSVSKKTMLWKNRLADQIIKNNKINKKSRKNLAISQNKTSIKKYKFSIAATRSPKNRLNFNKSSSNVTSNLETPSTSKKETKASPVVDCNKENLLTSTDTSKVQRERTGPRVKNVSRHEPYFFSKTNFDTLSCDNNNSLTTRQRGGNKYLEHLKNINADNGYNFTSWNTFTTNFDTEFILSALPNYSKQLMRETFEKSIKDSKINKDVNDENDTENVQYPLNYVKNETSYIIKNESNQNAVETESNSNLQVINKFKKISSNHFFIKKNNQNKFLKNKKNKILKSHNLANLNRHYFNDSNEQLETTANQFNFDDYFEKFHRISTNQNFRFSSLITTDATSSNDNDSDENVILQKVAPNRLASNQSQIISSKTRLNYKLNSYKDNVVARFHPYNNISYEGQTSNGSSSSFLDSSGKIDGLKNLFGKQNTEEVHKNNKYLVWDIKNDTDLAEIWKNGFTTISFKPFCIKSACFICGTSDRENRFLYCSVCCEPFHHFCLDENEQPKKETKDLNWICPTCKFCEICKMQDRLLNCQKCENCYHSCCFKDKKYPKKPSKKFQIWVCFNCFECQKCNGKEIHYDKKIYNKFPGFDFNTCLKCLSPQANPEETLNKTDSLNEDSLKCSKCSLLINFSDKNDLNNDCVFITDLIKNTQNELVSNFINSLECSNCSKSVELKERLYKFKLKHINETLLILNEELLKENEMTVMLNDNQLVDQNYVENRNLTEYASLLLQIFLEKIQETELKEKLKNRFVETIEMFKNTKLESDMIGKELLEMKNNVENILNNNDLVTEPIIVNSENKIQQASIENQTTIKKGKITIDDLVKCPHEDHTYAISAASLEYYTTEAQRHVEDENDDMKNHEIPFLRVGNEATLNSLNKELISISKSVKNETQTVNTNKLSTDLFSKKNENKLEESDFLSNDIRECVTCKITGDHAICGRLLPFETSWIHINCLLWSNDVLTDGHVIKQIQNVLNKAKNTLCSYCGKEGASISCIYKNCPSSFHLNCAYMSDCNLKISKNNVKHKNFNQHYLTCYLHKADEPLKTANNLENLKCEKCYIIDTNEDSYRKKNPYPRFPIETKKNNANNNPYLLIGSLRINNLGELDSLSDDSDCLYPLNYLCSRLYWSTTEIGKKVSYRCRIVTTNILKNENCLSNQNESNVHNINNKQEMLLDEEVITSEISQEFIMAHNLKSNFDIFLNNFEKFNEENLMPDTFEFPFQVDGQNDKIDDNLVKTANSLKLGSISTSSVSFTNQTVPMAQSKCIIKIPNSNQQPIFSNISLNQNLPPKIVINANIINKPLIQTTTTTSALNPSTSNTKVFNINSQLKNFSNLKTTTPISSGTSSLSSGTDKPMIIRIENPMPTVNMPKNYNNVIKNTINEKKKTPIKKTSINNHFNNLEVNLEFKKKEVASSNILNNIIRQENVNNISPNSDVSNSSLNLNYSSLIINPMKLTFENSLALNDVNKLKNVEITMSQDHKIGSAPLPISSPLSLSPQIQVQQQVSSTTESSSVGKSKEEKLLKKQQKLNNNLLKKKKFPQNKPTVAALLSAVYEKTTPTENVPENNLNTEIPLNTSINSINVANNVNNCNAISQISEASLLVNKANNEEFKVNSTSSLALKKSTNSKSNNKLKDYFKSNDLNFYSNKNAVNNNNNTNHENNLALLPASSLLQIKSELLGYNQNNSDIQVSNTFGDSNQNFTIDNELIFKRKLSKLEKKAKKELLAQEKKLKKKNKLLEQLTTKSKTLKTKRKQYNTEETNHLIFEIIGDDGFYAQSKDINKVWRQVFEKVNILREKNNLKTLSYQSINGITLFGLNHKSLLYLLEQFESIQFCYKYKNKYIPRFNTNEKWIVNDGSARTNKTFDGKKKVLDAFHWLSSEHRNFLYLNLDKRFSQPFLQAAKALISTDMSNSMKYRHLKEFSKSGLIVKCSQIHGRGLFTLVDLHQSQMIIEYSGEIIRHQLCDKREKHYETKGIGCYMFRIDEFEVIDATAKGNQARFINHSCEPNCISKVLLIQGHKHIVIFAQRFINKGEELTYDYKFPKEDIKIQCLCKSNKCRKYLN